MATTIEGNGLVSVGGTSTSQGRVRLAEDTDNGSNYIELTAPASVTSNQTITFPDETGTVITSAAAATQANQETATSTTTYVSPGRQQYHPSAAKGWAKADMAGGAVASYNVSSITDGGTGNAICNWDIDFSSSSYAPQVQGWADATGYSILLNSSTSGSAVNSVFRNTAGTDQDPNYMIFIAFGDQ